MIIENIVDRDGDGFEYEVTVSDGKRSILCFAYTPVNKQNKNLKLYAFEPGNLSKVSNSKYMLKKLKSPFEYEIVAQVLDRDKGMAQVFGFVFEIGTTLSKEINNGDFVKFINIRMDCENF